MTIAHVTLYPPKGEKHVNASGVASYSKNLVTHMDPAQAKQIIICDSINGREAYKEKTIEVYRVFKRRPSFIVSIHKELKKLNPDVVHIQQELALFGGILTAYLLQWLVFLWRKKTIITLHGVVDPAMVNKKFVKENNSHLPAWLVRLAFRIIYTPLMRWPRKVIVHEQYFKDIMTKSYRIDPAKIAVVPHGIEALTVLDTQSARTALRIPVGRDVALFMGYATGYKGLDILIEGFAAYARKMPKAYLIIGAGKHPKLRDDERYLAEYTRLEQKAARLIPKGRYRWEGFIKESEIAAYYSASDVSLYPYTTALSSSGPMSFAIGYEKPFLVSTAFETIFSEYSQLLFERSGANLAKRLAYFFSHQDEYAAISSQLKRQRNWTNVSRRTMQLYGEVMESP